MRKLDEQEEKQRLNLYNQGLTDKQMAELLFISTKAVTNWRKARNIPANGGTGWGGIRKSK